MFLFILNTVGPVFLLLGAGFCAVRLTVLTSDAISNLMRFATHVALPCLLFRATSTIDLAAAYNWQLLSSYFGVAIVCFFLAFIFTQRFFQRRPGEAVAVSFGNLFSNLVLLGVPIVERALGQEALMFALALVTINVPVCYLVGISTMEGVRVDGRSAVDTVVVVLKTLLQNSLMMAILLGFIVNLINLDLPVVLVDSLDMLKAAALPCALFALGGVLTRYSLSKEIKEASMLSLVSLIVQPMIAFAVCTLFGLPDAYRNVVVIMSAMPPGINAVLFASLYSRGVGTASNTVLLANALSVVTISWWLWFLVL